MKFRLETLGCHILSMVNSGKKSIETIEESRSDVILMDEQLVGDLNRIESASSMSIFKYSSYLFNCLFGFRRSKESKFIVTIWMFIKTNKREYQVLCF